MATRNKVLVGPCCDVPFGDVIRQTAERLGVSQPELAKRLGVSQPRIAEIYRQASMTEALLDRLCAALDVQLEVRIVQ